MYAVRPFIWYQLHLILLSLRGTSTGISSKDLAVLSTQLHSLALWALTLVVGSGRQLGSRVVLSLSRNWCRIADRAVVHTYLAALDDLVGMGES